MGGLGGWVCGRQWVGWEGWRVTQEAANGCGVDGVSLECGDALLPCRAITHRPLAAMPPSAALCTRTPHPTPPAFCNPASCAGLIACLPASLPASTPPPSLPQDCLPCAILSAYHECNPFPPPHTEIKEKDYLTPDGDYRVDAAGAKTMLNSLMYKLSYYE